MATAWWTARCGLAAGGCVPTRVVVPLAFAFSAAARKDREGHGKSRKAEDPAVQEPSGRHAGKPTRRTSSHTPAHSESELRSMDYRREGSRWTVLLRYRRKAKTTLLSHNAC